MQDYGKLKILAIETTGPIASVALSLDGDIKSLRNESDYSHLEEITPMVKRLLEDCAVKPAELDAIAVSMGPGSFTGIRIGMATAKALALIWNKPVVEVPTLEAFAYSGEAEGRLICPIFDARRSQVYGGAFRYKGPKSHEIAVISGAYSIDEYLAAVAEKLAENEIPLFFGDGVKAFSDKLEGWGREYEIAPEQKRFQLAENDLRLALRIYEQGGLKDAYSCEPEYLRQAEAERKLAEKCRG